MPIVLVAAKILYFGVGGSVDEFTAMAEAAGATVTTVLDIELGVGRRILKLEFMP
jgi:protein-histidine N-methyltransferase